MDQWDEQTTVTLRSRYVVGYRGGDCRALALSGDVAVTVQLYSEPEGIMERERVFANGGAGGRG